MDRLHERLTKYADSILKTKITSDKGKLDGLKVEISGPRYDSEKKCKLNFAIHDNWEKISRFFPSAVFSVNQTIF